jgi:hypothetical protein
VSGSIELSSLIDSGADHHASGLPKRAAAEEDASMYSGGNVGGAIPDPIPNSEVKPSRADGTAEVAPWESRTLPG